jgi:hypothetical protein
MRALIFSIALCGFIGLTAIARAESAKIACPYNPPADWATAGSRLDAIRVLSFPSDAPPLKPGDPLPTMVPDDESTSPDGIIHQTWNMNADAPKFKYQIDCLYTGTERFIRMDAAGVKRCDARFRLSHSDQTVSKPGFKFECK